MDVLASDGPWIAAAAAYLMIGGAWGATAFMLVASRAGTPRAVMWLAVALVAWPWIIWQSSRDQRRR